MNAVKHPSTNPAAVRSGIVLLGVIVAIAVLGALCHTLAGLAVRRYRQVENDVAQAQVRWLAESAVLRATRRLDRDKHWQGETWTPDFSNSESPAPRKASVVLTPTETNGQSSKVHIQAEWTVRETDIRRIDRTVLISGLDDTQTESSAQ